MKITVLNGSPKGELSATLHYIHFIQKKYPEIEVTIHHISQKIKGIEKNESKFNTITADVASADAVWWSVPIYVFVIPSQMVRFIELLSERGVADRFKDKYTAVFTTSIHFYDHTGNNYMHAVCDDLGMKYVDHYSAGMYDLMQEEEQDRLLDFAGQFLSVVEKEDPVPPVYRPLDFHTPAYSPGKPKKQVDQGNKQILLLSDRQEEGTNLEHMILRFCEAFSAPIKRVNLDDIGIKGGCLGCIKCGFDNLCAYEKSDTYTHFYRETVATADIVIYAGKVTGRYLSSAWKQFFDRRFFNTHIPTLQGKQIGYILEGPLSQLTDLREVLTAMVEMDQAGLGGIVTDEFGEPAEIDALLDRLAEKLVAYSERGFRKPATFRGVAGHKVFRDAVWSHLRFPFLADHKYYSENGYYDFPREDDKALESSLQMIEAVQDPEARKEIRKSLKTGLLEPLKHIIETR